MVNLANNEEMKDYQKPEMEVIELHIEGNLLVVVESLGDNPSWGIDP